MIQSERNFYHSFPRIRPNDSRERIIKCGLETLKAIRQVGIVLAPEILTWKQSPGTNGRTLTMRQCRICFTELSRNEVEEHGKKFGPFSIELPLDTLRRLGALPVIYMPQHLKDDGKFSAVGAMVVAQLADIKHTINMLHQLWQSTDDSYLITLAKQQGKEASSVAENCVIDLTNTDDANRVVCKYQIPRKTIKDILSFIGYRNAPFHQMDGVASLIQSLFYPTDDDKHDSLLTYYRQREWRLVAGLALHDKQQSRKLTTDEINTLLNIDAGFWAKALFDGKVSFRRVDEAQAIESFEGNHIAEMISTIIVPAEACDEARKIFGDKVQAVEKSK
jgi:hypothetical protein